MGQVTYKDIVFEWDDIKKNANPAKHDGVTFEEELDVFFDPGAVVNDAGRNDEERDGLIGYGAKDRILFVVSIEGTESGYRLISARKAEPHERGFYEEGKWL